MAVQMPKLERDPKSGNWRSRKSIPVDVRAVFGKREDKPSWPATLSEKEAVGLYCSWLKDIEARIEAARTGPVTLSEDQVKALAGRWYRERLREEEALGDPSETLTAVLEVLREPSQTRDGLIRNAIVGLLQSEGLIVAEASRRKLAAELVHLHIALYETLWRRSNGDHSADTVAVRIPEWKRPESAALLTSAALSPTTSGAASKDSLSRSGGLTLIGLYDYWAAHSEQGGNAKATLTRYRGVFDALSAYLRHPKAASVTEADIRRYFEFRMSKAAEDEEIAPRTARGVHRAALNSVFEWAIGKGVVTTNPVAGYRIKYRKGSEGRGRGFRDEEARSILDAALAVPPDAKHPTRAAAKRWVPFLCAYTGSRVGEMLQLRAEDIQEKPGGFWVLRITPDAGTVKDGQERFVPLHPKLVEMGFPAFAKAGGDRLFYAPGGNAASDAAKTLSRATELAKWVRSVAALTDAQLQPNHAWRHRFKTVARQAEINEQYVEAITGHAPGSVGRRYGEHRPEVLYREVCKLAPALVEGRPISAQREVPMLG